MENQKQLTAEQSLQVLDNVTAQVKLTREEQGLVIQALQTLAALVAPAQPEVKGDKE